MYTVIVLAFTVKDGVPTLAANFTTAQDVPDHPPSNVTTYNTSSTSVNVTWQPIPLDQRNGILQGYHVKYWRHDRANDNISMVTVNSTSLYAELEGLGKYKEYVIQVAGSTVAGLGTFSEPVSVRTEQDVPDEPPGNIRASGIEPTILKVDWSPVPYETINGIGIGYKLALFNTSAYNIRNYTLEASVLSLEITDLDIWTNYSVQMSAFTVVGDGPWSESILEDTDEEAPNKSPANLTGEATNSTSIFLQWDAVVLPNIRGILRGYRVHYEEAPGSVHASVLRNVSVDIAVTEVELINLQKFTAYRIWVTAFTTTDGELSNSIFVRTREDTPGRPPLYITYSSPSSTSLLVEWGAIPPQFKNGIIRGFQVHFQYNGTVEVRMRGPRLYWVILVGLKKFTVYHIRVFAFTNEGYGPESNITAVTGQDVPSKPPEGIVAESHVTLTSIPVTWQPIDSSHIHGILLGYKIRYQAVAIGEEPVEDEPIREEIVSPSTFFLLLKNLEIFTLYRIDVMGYTIMGNGPPATDYAETCRCYKRLTTSWYEFRPYVRLSENGFPDGLIPPILKKLTVRCCETCKSHGTSYVDLTSNALNQSAKLPNLHSLRKSISNPTDFFFPVYGFKEQTHFAKQFGYQGIVESPGMAYIINTNPHDDMPNAVLTNIAACWPAIALALVITYLAGLAVWLVESDCNPQDFPRSFIEGAYEAFYWSFVSMTTVGYGDRAPITILGRFLAIAVIMSGLVIFGIVNGYMATSITSVALETDYKIYGAKVAAIEGTPEYRMGLRKNARMDQGPEYHTFHDIYTALSERHVIGALIDTYSAGSSKEEFENEHLRVNQILDFSSTYGVVMGKEARKLRRCFKDYTEKGFASEIAHHIQRNTEQLKEPPEPLPVERSTGFFDSHSTAFQNTLLISGTLLISCILCGIIWDIIRHIRGRTKIKPRDSRLELVVELKVLVDNFNDNIHTVKKNMASRHKKERKKLLMSYKQLQGKYDSSMILTQQLDNPYFDPQPNELSSTHDETEANC